MKVIKVIKYLYLGLMALLIVILGIFLISSLFRKTSYTKVFGFSFFEVQSYSMYPELDKGDLVIVKTRKVEDYKVDMIVTYIKPTDEIPTTHKIVNIDGNIITTRGINKETNNSDDEPFDVSCIIGEVTAVWRNYNIVRDFITNPIGILIIILTGFLIIELINYVESYHKKKEE